MKIVVQKQIIDTENIYRIGEICDGGSYYGFDIGSFNDKVLYVFVSYHDDLEGEQDKIIAQISVPGVSVEALYKERREVLDTLPLKNRARLERM